MNLAEWKTSLNAPEPPRGFSGLVEALWWEAGGDWARAHEIAQEREDSDAAWVHAYLHRREGNAVNARYWYRRAGKPVCMEPLDAEREAIAARLLAGAGSR